MIKCKQENSTGIHILSQTNNVSKCNIKASNKDDVCALQYCVQIKQKTNDVSNIAPILHGVLLPAVNC